MIDPTALDKLIDRTRSIVLGAHDGAPLTTAELLLVSSALSELRAWQDNRREPEWAEVFGEQLIPPTGMQILKQYVEHGVPPGDTWRAILSSDMREAFRLADQPTARGMAAIAAYLYNSVPAHCYGSPKRVDHWIALHHMARGFDAALQIAFDPVTLKVAGDAPQLRVHGQLIARYVGAQDGALRFQLGIEWHKTLRTDHEGLRLALPSHSPAYVVDVDALEPPDADNVISVKLSSLRTGYE